MRKRVPSTAEIAVTLGFASLMDKFLMMLLFMDRWREGEDSTR